jgi:hypothetical protein
LIHLPSGFPLDERFGWSRNNACSKMMFAVLKSADNSTAFSHEKP